MININNLKNTYFTIRHGQSLANVEKLICSDPKNGSSNYGLSDLGKKQVANNISKDHLNLDKNTIIISSNFLRTKETAQICKDILQTKNILIEPRLQERYFGDFELTDDSNYKIVWDHTKKTNDEYKSVETIQNVWNRFTDLITELEDKYDGENILFVSHGDPIKIMIAGFKGDISLYNDVGDVETAQIINVKEYLRNLE